MPKTIDRITHIIKIFGLSARQFDMSIGASNGYTLRMSKNNASVGSDVLAKILEKYPVINAHWLITGQGDMFNTSSKAKTIDAYSISEEEIEAIIDKKLKEHDSKERDLLMDEIKKEIEATKKGLK
ncbi:hypothetical protein [Zhouia amylolytica]|uniref:HTH cro/C1-type domain-containing protein n=2 Tax=Zhouia amylolytica TaxID=376730 RepID=W2UNH9_9FLAO|nr:hypothetical protein [Zhouia amylolytica]ETN95558.1 hypothetical protein P278_12800 [Zhouia amylolytica AD3]MCQ0110751.1 hypothetical protein [Zhouia amylolytica]